MSKNYIALENTSQEIKSIVDDISGNIMGLGVNFIGTDLAATGGTTTTGTLMAKSNAALTKADDIIQNLGNTGDTGGSSTAGTIYAKENKILTNLATCYSGVTTVGKRTQTILTNVNAIQDVIGTTTDTGGTTTEGSLAAKLNTLLSSSSGGTSIIRNIQRGQSIATNGTANITLSGFTNIDKMIVILIGGIGGTFTISGTKYYGSFPLSINSLTTTKLSVIYAAEKGISITLRAHAIHYQVIEFY